MRVVVQDNLWFQAHPQLSNYVWRGQWMCAVWPRLGLTGSSDWEAKLRELRWLVRYTTVPGEPRDGSGLIVAQEWIKPDRRRHPDLADRNLPGWLDEVLPTRRRALWCIFYDPVLAVRQRGLSESDWRVPELRRLWSDDLTYLERYAAHPQYWRRDGRAVLYVWAVHGGMLHPDACFREAAERGFYILADVLGGRREPAGMDGATGFVAVLPGMGGRIPYPQALAALRAEMDYWRDRTPTFVPASSLQYDDRNFQVALGAIGRPPSSVLARNRSDLDEAVATLREYAHSDVVMAGTANNWAEGTTVLPTLHSGPRFSPGIGRLGHYEFEHLQALRRGLFPG